MNPVLSYESLKIPVWYRLFCDGSLFRGTSLQRQCRLVVIGHECRTSRARLSLTPQVQKDREPLVSCLKRRVGKEGSSGPAREHATEFRRQVTWIPGTTVGLCPLWHGCLLGF